MSKLRLTQRNAQSTATMINAGGIAQCVHRDVRVENLGPKHRLGGKGLLHRAWPKPLLPKVRLRLQLLNRPFILNDLKL
eukprot:1416967-Pleurochrysis_carterae.AAC.1